MALSSVTQQLAAQSTASSSRTAAQAGDTALSSLSGNFQNFLQMLMTQLRNQDPTSPLDTNQFTTELAQFASVEQQIHTNTSLTNLIELTQAGEVIQSTPMIGRKVAVASDTMPLQSGSGTLRFTAQQAGPVAIAIYNDAGTKIRDAVMTASKGDNSWTWDGKDASGKSRPDGGYKVAVARADDNGKAVGMPFTVVGTATGMASDGGKVQVQFGSVSVPFTAIRSVVN